MNRTFSALLRLGPSLAYAIAGVFLLSMVFLGAHPSSAFAWALYMTLLPVMREPVDWLLSVPGVDLWAAVALLFAAALAGIHLALRPALARTGFLHAHVALLGLVLAMGHAATAQADSVGIFFPRVIDGDWTFQPIQFPIIGLALFLLVLVGCVPTHLAMAGRARRRALDRAG